MTPKSALPVLLSAALIGVFLLPVLLLLFYGVTQISESSVLNSVVLDALQVSLTTTLCTLGLTLLLGTPLAWWLARFRWPGKAVLETLLDLPLVLPPVVAGVALLLTFGRHGLLGAPLELAGITLAFSPGAVVLAQLFVSAPLYLRTAKAGFMSVEREIEEAAHMDGGDFWATFRYVTWPLAFPFVLEGLVMTWARALGEFGATILFAGSLQGKTRTLPLAIYAALESDLGPAMVMSAIMVVVAFGVLLLVRLLTKAQAQLYSK